MKTSHTDKFTSVVLTRPLLLVIPLGCLSSLWEGIEHLWDAKQLILLLGTSTFSYIAFSYLFSVLSLTKMGWASWSSVSLCCSWQPSKIPYTWNRTAGAAPPVFPSTKQKLQKQSLEAEIYPAGHCEHWLEPQRTLDAKQVPEILNSALLANLASHLGIIVGPIQLLHDSFLLFVQIDRRLLFPF